MHFYYVPPCRPTAQVSTVFILFFLLISKNVCIIPRAFVLYLFPVYSLYSNSCIIPWVEAFSIVESPLFFEHILKYYLNCLLVILKSVQCMN